MSSSRCSWCLWLVFLSQHGMIARIRATRADGGPMWGQPFHDGANTGSIYLGNDDARNWTVTVPSQSTFLSPQAVGSDGTIYTMTTNVDPNKHCCTYLRAFSPMGDELWNAKLSDVQTLSSQLLAGQGGIVYAYSSDKLLCYEAGGSIRWSKKMDDHKDSYFVGALLQSKAYVGFYTDHMIGFSHEDGSHVWDRSDVWRCFPDELCFMQFRLDENGNIYVLTEQLSHQDHMPSITVRKYSDEGELMWTSRAFNGTRGSAVEGIAVSSAAHKPIVVFRTGQVLQALSGSDGVALWSAVIDVQGAFGHIYPTLSSLMAYVSTDDALHAFHLSDGSAAWVRNRTGGRAYAPTPLVYDKVGDVLLASVYTSAYSTQHDYLEVLDARTSRLLGTLDLGVHVHQMSPAILVDGRALYASLVVNDGNGRYVFYLKSYAMSV